MVREIFDWHANEGLSLRVIAIRLTDGGVSTPNGHRSGRPRRSSGCLRNTVYIGTLYYNRRVDVARGCPGPTARRRGTKPSPS